MRLPSKMQDKNKENRKKTTLTGLGCSRGEEVGLYQVLRNRHRDVTLHYTRVSENNWKEIKMVTTCKKVNMKENITKDQEKKVDAFIGV